MWTLDSLINEFNKIGIEKGSKIIVHSSFKSFGEVENGPQTIVNALISAVGENGLILMPTFSFSFENENGKSEIFDKNKTPSRVGIITEFFWKTQGVVRSEHPTHSVALYGNDKDKILKDLPKSALGKNSAFYKVAMMGATIYHFGCGFKSSSLIHTGEILSDAFYKEIFSFSGVKNSALIKKGEEIVSVPLVESPGCSASFDKLEPLAIEQKRLKILNDKLKVKYIKAKDLLDLTIDVLRKDPTFLLCEKGTCEVCDEHWEAWESITATA